MGYFLLILSWGFFYFTHSFFASTKLKRILKVRWERGFKSYRLFYSLFSLLLFLAIMIQSILIPAQYFLPQKPLLTYLGYMIATFGTILMVRSSKQINLKSFLGIVSEPSNQKLVTTGLYSKIRHPLYIGLMMIFFGYVLVSAQYTALIHFICLVVYLPFGMYYEEKNLIDQYGEAYRTYQKNVPMIFPNWSKKKRA
ncbi:isoprenylcysteine carboxylmethyltransferase family protein [Algoriphagus aestuarii]|nr:isoprenylcysteine carboxylmethyltransferase family protein [Algoriphagus aestuarii]